jgi:hypothetical protein
MTDSLFASPVLNPGVSDATLRKYLLPEGSTERRANTPMTVELNIESITTPKWKCFQPSRLRYAINPNESLTGIGERMARNEVSSDDLWYL